VDLRVGRAGVRVRLPLPLAARDVRPDDPPATRNTAFNASGVLASVTNWDDGDEVAVLDGLASCCDMYAHTCPLDLYPPCELTTSLQLTTRTFYECLITAPGSSGPE
jgi:hypothetical protein